MSSGCATSPARSLRCFSIWRSSATVGATCPASLPSGAVWAPPAVNLYLRRPDIFCGCLALSGIYTAHYGFGDYMDELVYMNSPVDYMKNFPEDHPYMQLFRSQKAVICCGQGDWEQPDTTWLLKRIFEAKHIPIWVDLWGHDVNHDWNWWYKQVAYYMPYILGQQ